MSFDLRIAVSNSHVHLSKLHTLALFGVEELPPAEDIGHPTCSKSGHVVTLVGPKASLEGVRVLTPSSSETWVELNRTHAFALGVQPPLEEGVLRHGELLVRGPRGAVPVKHNVVIELRHLELTPTQAKHWGLEKGQLVSAQIDGPRGLLFRNVKVRVIERARPDFEGVLELDRDEANAALVNPGDRATILLG